MILRLATAAHVILGGCGHQTQSDSEALAKSTTTIPSGHDALRISGSLTRGESGADLVLTYAIENHGTAPIWVLEQIVTTSREGMVVLPDRVIVRRGPDDATASFVIGFTRQPGHAVAIEPPPVAHALAAGATLTGMKHVPLPLAAWHPYDSMIDHLVGLPAKALLEFSWLPERPPQGVQGWQDVPAARGGTLHLPSIGFVGTSVQTSQGPVLGLP